ncbi:guanosine-3',5'-bis(diphosphate) 3'-pyrophosphohydrolase [Haemophilus influenzae]|nr:guanosine-3',5'-bis(diphosphate) 3'-pyrophosphohydrolase [Haemophilus influenzae]EDJ87811.1 hypothetical protein CGSHi22121_00462 [Haemophilus influenzae 22.1-21]AXP56655.1 guanosine-3',5'-bis(diphosphate) 3'-pyrophosphohydrolase [Haemophilus influenzae]AXP66878.1 guanosine-3',5'-bis(diphosphate) 3'-pyrophosphohydrolase [Haemophilus influenzae]AYO34949.1 guanosine-3',5'-bis(diphosphate) 3'-pyrophosphohydrolase [Haemophilus influenzae]
MNRQVFTIAIFPTEGLQALKSELFDVVFVEHDEFLSVWFKSPLTLFTKEGNGLERSFSLGVFHE